MRQILFAIICVCVIVAMPITIIRADEEPQSSQTQAAESQPTGRQESALDAITWQTDVAAAVERANNEQLPLFALYIKDEKAAVADVFDHPLIMDAVEGCFVPLHISDAHKNMDAAKKTLGIPSVQTPCVRVTSANGKDVTEPLVITSKTALTNVATLLTRAMESEQRAIPRYLNLLEYEARIRTGEKLKKAYFAHG